MNLGGRGNPFGTEGLGGGLDCGWRFGLVHAFWANEDDDSFGEAVVGALVVGIEEVLQEAEAAFEGGGRVAEGALDGLEQRETRMGEGDDADAEEALAGGEAVGEAKEEAEVEDEEDCPENFKRHVHAELGLGMDVMDDDLVGIFADVKLVLDEILQSHLGGEVKKNEKEAVEEEGPEATGERGERNSGERVLEVCLVGIEETGALVQGHRDNIAGWLGLS